MKHALSSTTLKWTNVQCPQPAELAEFIREANVTAADAEFMTQRNHRPSLTVRPDYLLLLIHVPVFDRKVRLTRGVALYFIVTADHLFSLHYEPIVLLDKIRMDLEANPVQMDELLSSDSLKFCLDLMADLYQAAWRKLDRLAKHIEIAEDAVFQGNERKMVEETSLLTRDVMDFRKVIRPQKNLIAAVPQHKLVSAEAARQWERVSGLLKKMWEALESMFESTRELSHTNFTLIQHKQNELLRVLTIYSLIVVPMLSLTDPIFDPSSPDASLVDIVMFWVILSLMLLILAIILLHSRRRRLL